MMEPAGNPFQRTAEWLSDKCGCLSASRMADALDRRKDGSPGARATKLLKSILAERMTSDSVRNYVTPEMQRGIDMEEAARNAYEAHTGRFVTLTGFLRHPTIEYCGASPDGLVGADGLVEIKAPQTATHIDYLLGGVPPVDYHPQMLLQLAVTRRAWCDFVSYDDRIKDPRKRLFVARFTPTAEDIANIEAEARAFLALVDRLWEQLTTQAA